MRGLLVLSCFSVLLAGVFGADVTVTVMKGDSVTLLINSDEIKGAERLFWKFENSYIAANDLEVKSSQTEYPDNRFRGRLNLDHNTGSLTINNIRTEDTGVYQLEIRSSGIPVYKTFSVTVNDEPNTFSVIKGDPVTLPTGVKIQPHDVRWMFKGKTITGLTDSTITNMKVNPQTGELNIRNIRPDQSGEYEVEIKARDFIIHRIFHVNFNEVESVLWTKGESVILHTNTPTQADDMIEWKFKNTLIAQFNRMANKFSYADAKWRDRLQMDISGSLTITQLKTEDSGPYDVIINNSHRFIHKRFSLTVTDQAFRMSVIKEEHSFALPSVGQIQPDDVKWKLNGTYLTRGVFGADNVTVSVMRGDYVTLPINSDEIKERLLWKYNNSNIASFNLLNKNTPAVYPNDRFKGRLNVDPKTGSLNITNIRTEDTGVYQLEIKNSGEDDKLFKTFSVTVTDQEITVSVMKEDNFSLTTGVKIQTHDVKWTFNGYLIEMDMDVNQQTGEVTIRPEKSGKYDVKINSRFLFLERTFRVNVSADMVESISEMQGETVRLGIDNTAPQTDDLIEWKFGNTIIAQLNKTNHKPNRDRLHVDRTGSLIISKVKGADTGLYIVNITNSNRFIHKRFSLTITESRSHQVKIGPGLFLVLIMLVLVLV